MNWAGSDLIELVAAWLGALLGAVTYAMLASRGHEAPWLLGLGAGLAVMLVARKRSRTRGLIVATLAVWSAASAQAYCFGRGSMLEALRQFHESLTPGRWLWFALTAVIALVLGAGSVRRDAQIRRAGT